MQLFLDARLKGENKPLTILRFLGATVPNVTVKSDDA